jgi:RHS repeat-associated protein
MKFADYRRVYDLVPLCSTRPRERVRHVLRALLLLFALWITVALLWVGPIGNATAQQTETISAIMNYVTPVPCNSEDFPFFATRADVEACIGQWLIRDDAGWRLTGNSTQETPDITCLETIDIAPPNAINPCNESYDAVGVCPPGYSKISADDSQQVDSKCSITLTTNDQTQKPSCQFCVGNPISPGTGNKQQIENDYGGFGPTALKFQRFYNSNPQYGGGWRHSYDSQLNLSPNSNNALSIRPEGNVSFTYNGSTWVADADVNFSLQTGLVYPPNTTDVEVYNNWNSGITTLRTADFITKQDFTYSDSSTPITVAPTTGLLIAVTDFSGKSLALTYDAQSRISTMTDPGGGLYQYAYDTAGNLSSVTYPDSTSRQYLYNEPAQTSGANLPNALTGIIDESGTRFATFGYNSAGLAIHSEHAGGNEAVDVIYGTQPVLQCDSSIDVTNGIKYQTCYYVVPSTPTQVTDSLGVTRNYGFTAVLGAVHATGVDTPCFTNCAAVANTQTFDANGNLTAATDFDGNQTTYTYDLSRNLEAGRTEAAGSPHARSIATSWNSTFRRPDLITEPNRTTGFTYDGGGNVLTKTVTDTSVTPNSSRTWTYTYNSFGQVLTEDGPRTDVSDVTTYTYYNCVTGYECGQLLTVSNAANQTTTYNTYNAHGQPLTLTDPNGTVTTLTYDARQRLTSRQTAGETTAFDYWPTGLLKKVTLPDGSYLGYTYDGAHRLTQITDALGNKTVYTLDAMGNRTAQNTYDPGNALRRTHTRVFNTMNQLWKDVNAAGTAAATTTFGYDLQGNQTSIAATLARNTANAYDELNRLKQITDPASGITQFGYDAQDNLMSVTDPSSLTTSYIYDGFGDLVTQTSPDTGATVNTYDSGGNLATSTDARSAVSTYTYDALNRVTSVAYSLAGTADQTLSFTYDSGTNGSGHLTGASDDNQSLAWSYDALGRVTGKAQTVSSITSTVGYAYTNGNLTTLTTPSGQTVTYGYNGNHQVTSIAVNGATVLNSVTYDPLGPVSGWTWSNSTTTTRTYDSDGKVSQIVSAGTKTFGYDDAFRVTGTTDTSPGSTNWTYGYDALDRLTSGASPSVTRGWTYDANGNRLTETGSAPSTYTLAPSSNRIANITGALARTYAYDGAGNTTGYSTVTASYSGAGRLTTLANGSTTETALYNALGQRIQIGGGVNGTVLYAYDEAGHLLGEYDGTGTLIQETVWLGDIPVATLRPSGSTVAIYYVHTDQLNTPRQVTRPSDNAAMWTWNSDPFGTDAANANPAGAGTFAFNLRLPGQVFDGQAGLHYNGYRDYDPATGRYVEVDPIGLHGGVNPYRYSNGNPVSSFDPTGLMCVAGVGCWTTPPERNAANSGDYDAYYQLACAGGDAYACYAQHIEANDNTSGHVANWWLKKNLHKAAEDRHQCLDDQGILKQIRQDLAKAYASSLPSSMTDARWPSAMDISQIHWDEFAKYGLPPSAFGGTPLGSWVGPVGSGIWCPNCGP